MNINAAWIASHVNRPQNANMNSVIQGIIARPSGLQRPNRFGAYLGQLDLESGSFKYDKEIWGPTKTQLRYEGRKTLGNTQPGDGYKFRGRGPIQITGRANTTAFRDWCRKQGLNPPDFAENPDLINTDPWEGLGPIWYWETRGLNALADVGNVNEITRKINGGYNGLAERIRWTDSAWLKLAGFSTVKAFQQANKLTADGVIGPITRGAIFKSLRDLPDLTFS